MKRAQQQPPAVILQVDELVVEGLDPGLADALRPLLEQELARRIAAGELSVETLSAGGDIHLGESEVEVAPGTSPEEMSARLTDVLLAPLAGDRGDGESPTEKGAEP